MLGGSVAARGSEGDTAVIYAGWAGQGSVLTGGAGGPGAGSLGHWSPCETGRGNLYHLL